MIESVILDYLAESLDVPVFLEVPPQPPERYVVFERTGSTNVNGLQTTTLAVQSCAPTLFTAASLNELVRAAMTQAPDQLVNVFAVRLSTDYNFSDIRTKVRRYQAIYYVTHRED